MRTAEFHRIACPYEPVGYGTLIVDKYDGAMDIRIKEALKCNFCHRYFTAKPYLKFKGVPLELEKTPLVIPTKRDEEPCDRFRVKLPEDTFAEKEEKF